MGARRWRPARAAGSRVTRPARTCSNGARAAPPSSPASEPCSPTIRGWTCVRRPRKRRPPRNPKPPRQPLRVVLDSHLRTPPGARLLAGGGEVLIMTAQTSLKDVQSGMRLTARGARLESAPEDDNRLSLAAVLGRLAELEVNELQ